MKHISLSKGKMALVDDNIFDVIGHLKWTAQKRKNNLFYAVRHFRRLDGSRDLMYLHHVVTGFPLHNMKVDHKDGNGLNNQKDNLRIVTTRGNGQNQSSHRNGNKLLGATYDKQLKKWRAQILINGDKIRLGSFNTELEASNAYNNFVLSKNLK